MALKKSKAEIATIDCSLVTIEIPPASGTGAATEFGFETASKIAVEPVFEEQDAVKLVIKGKLKAQKKAVKTLTGHTITLTDNVFNPELVVALQGGTATYTSATPPVLTGYTPPVAGSAPVSTVFKLHCYSAQYNAAGQIVNYEKISYPNCTGSPIAFSSEDGVFRAPEYVIDSAPDTGEAPYTITYVETLPTMTT